MLQLRKVLFCLQETRLQHKDIERMKADGQKKIYQANNNQKKTSVAIVISDKIFNKRISRNKQSHIKMIKYLIYKEDIILNCMQIIMQTTNNTDSNDIR